jgi:hypothetical protein
MKYICEKKFTSIEYYSFPEILKSIKKIVSAKFPDEFKIMLMRKLIIYNDNIRARFDIIMGTTYSYNSSKIHFDNIQKDRIEIDFIKKFYKKFGFTLGSYRINYSDLQITKIYINDKNIEIGNLMEKCNITGTIGHNISSIISMHIAKLLIGIETL